MPKNINRPPRYDNPDERAQWDEDVEEAINKLALSSHAHGTPTLFLTNMTGTTASNSAGLTLSLSVGAAGGADGVNILAAGTQTANTTGTIMFSNSNGITFGMSNSSIITAQHNAITTGMASNRGTDFVQATAAFAGTSASGTINSTGISVSIGPYITTGALSNHSHGVSFTSGSTVFQTLSFTNSNGISFNSGTQGIFGSHNAITTARASTDAVGLNTALTAGPLAWTVNSAGISLNAGSAAGTSTGFAGANISGSITHNTAGLNLSLSVAAPGGGNVYSYFAYPDDVGNSITHTVGQSTSYVQPFDLPYALSVSFIRLPLTLSCIGSHAATASAANQTRGMTLSSTHHLVFYTQGTGASSRSLVYYTSASASWVQLATLQAGATGSHWSSGHTISFPREGGNTDFTTSAAATSASYTIQSSQLSDFTGLRFFAVPFAGSFAAGMYWLAMGTSSSLSTVGNANMSTLRILASGHAITQPNQAFNLLGSATNSSNHYRIGLGSYTTNAIATTASIALANISTTASHIIYPFEMIRQA